MSDWGWGQTQSGGPSWGWGGTTPKLHTSAGASSSGGGGGNSSFWPDIVSDIAGNALHNVTGYAAGAPKIVGSIGGAIFNDFGTRPTASLIHGHPLGFLEHTGQAWGGLFTAGMLGSEGFNPTPWNPKKGEETQLGSRIGQILGTTVEDYAHKYNPAGGGGITGLANRIFVKDPVGTLLDLSVAGRFIGSAAKVAAEGGRLGESAKALSEYQPARRYNPEGGITEEKLRQLQDAPYGPLTEGQAARSAAGGLVRDYTPARTLQGMYRQRWFDSFSQEHEALMRFGSEARISRVLSSERRAAVSQAMVDVRRENLLRSRLTPDEVNAVDVVLEGSRLSAEPIKDLVNFFTHQAEGKISQESARGIQEQLDRLSTIPESVITHPSDEFLKYISHLRKMDETVSQAAIASGRLAAVSREARRFLPQRIMSGSRVESNKEQLNAMRNTARKEVTRGVNRRHDLETQLGRHKENITNLSAFIKRMEEELKTGATSSTIAKRELRFARRRLKTAEINHDRVERWLAEQKVTNKELKATKAALKKAKPEKTWQGGTPLADLQSEEANALRSFAEGGAEHGPLAQFGPTFRQAHTVLPPKSAAGLFRDRVISMISRNPRVPDVYKFNEGKIFQSGLLAMNPERFSTDFMVQMQYSHALDVFRHQVLPLARDIDPHEPYNSQTDAIVWTNPETKGAALEGGPGRSVPRVVSQLDQATQDVGTNIAQAQQRYEEWAKQFIDDGIPARYLDHFGDSSEALKQMKKDGAMIVPRAAQKVFEHEISKTSENVRFFWDRGLMGAWRYLTLNLVPRWLVNNAVTSMSLYALNYAGREGLDSFLQAVKREKPELARRMEGMSRAGRVRARLGNTYVGQMASGTLERPAGRFVEDQGMGFLHQSSFSANERRTYHPGIFAKEQEVRYAKLNARLQKGGRPVAVSARGVATGVRTWGKWITNLNAEIENIFRDAGAIAEAKMMAKKMGMANQTLAQLGKAMAEGRKVDEHLPLKMAQQVIDVMGDFGGLSRREQQLRRFVAPFYSWYKTITVVTAKLIVREPLRVAVLAALSDAALKQPYLNFGFPVPPYLASYIPFSGDPSGQGGAIGALSPVGANPFQTPLDLTLQTTGLLGLTDQSAQSSPLSYLNPFLQAGITTGTGQDTFYGGQYSGPGSSRGPIGRGLGSLIDIPQQRLLSQLHPGGWAPGGQYQSRTFQTTGSSAVPGLDQGQLDGILQYLGIPVRHVSPQGARERANLSGGGTTGGSAPTPDLSPPTSTGTGSSGWGW